MYTPALQSRIRTLRKKGYTYPEICEAIKQRIPKSSLSYICKNLELSPQAQKRHRQELNQQLAQKRQKALAANRAKVSKRMQYATATGFHIANNMEHDTLKIALAMLYWGEGYKYPSYRGLSLGSSDPIMLTTYMRLLQQCYGVPTQNFRARIMRRADQDEAVLLGYWSQQLTIPEKHFYKTYSDARTVGKPSRKQNCFGVCTISCAGVHIQLELQAIWEAVHRHTMSG